MTRINANFLFRNFFRVYLRDSRAPFFCHSFVIRHSEFVISNWCPVVVGPLLPGPDGFQARDAVRVTVTETCLASSKGNFRSSTVTFWMRKVLSKCVASRSASVSIRLAD